MRTNNKFPSQLVNGYSEFRRHRFASEQSRYNELAIKGQKPETLIIACCDSRAAPETIFNASPGEMFVVRNVANLVPPYQPDFEYHSTSAAIEYAVQILKVKNIVVLGHARCGGIHEATNPNSEPGSSGKFIAKWLDLLSPVISAFKDSYDENQAVSQIEVERASIVYSIRNLRSFPFIKEHIEAQSLDIFGSWFDIKSGELWVTNSNISSDSSLSSENSEFYLVEENRKVAEL